MLLFLSFESEFENFKLAATKDEIIRNAVESSLSGETAGNVFNELLRAETVPEFIDISEKYRIPIQRLLYEWNYVPAEDSPKHILNVLNNHCIQEILLKLSEPCDFLSAAETCYRFQANALQCYPRRFKSFSVGNKSHSSFIRLSLEHVPNFLKIFGHLIISIELISDFDSVTLSTIAENCGETLSFIRIDNHENTIDNFNELSKFKALKSILMHNISMDDLELHGNLEQIVLYRVKVQTNMQCIMKKFPKLKVAHFSFIDNLSDTEFNTFITLNPQIQHLEVMSCFNVSNSAIDSISDFLPNLMHLGIDRKNLTTHGYNEMVMHLGKLQNLRHLQIIVHFHTFESLYPAVALIDSLVAQEPRIESLHLHGLHDFDKALTGLLRLMQLKELELISFNEDISINTILELIKKLPILKHLTFKNDTITVSEIMDILEYSRNLTKLEIFIHEMDMDLSTYNSILALIKGPLEVELRIWHGNIDENIFQENEQRLKIVKRQ